MNIKHSQSVFLLGSSLLLLGSSHELLANDVVTQGISPGTNTYQSFQNGSIARDSRLNQPLDLLNDFYPSISVTVSDHDNIRRRTDQDEPDTRITVAPSLGYRTNLGRHPFYVAYSGVLTYHDQFENEDAQSHNLSSNLSLDLSRRWDLDLFGAIGTGFEERGISGSRSLTGVPGANRQFDALAQLNQDPDEYDYETVGADLVYGRKGLKLKGVAGYERTDTEFTNNNQGLGNLTGARDRESESVHLDLDYELGDRTSVFGRAQYTEIDYVRSLNSLDSEQTDVLLGLRWKPSQGLSGVVAVGESDKDFIDPSREDYQGTAYYVNLSYNLTPYSVISLGASQLVEEPGDEFADFYESQLLGLAWDHSFTDALSAGVFVKWIDDDYSTGRVDEFTDFGVTLNYAFRSWLTAGLFYGQIERDSNIDNVAYEDRYFGLTLRSDLRALVSGNRDRKFVEPYSFEQDEEERQRYSKDRVKATQPNRN